ncbi:MAG: hypothetical protein RLY87_525 [Chloroflexota bacterium]|jgi:F420 biosynthesis protein FbiB-like protein
MELHDAIQRRASVRRFTSESIPAAVIDALLDAAALAPSAHGRQPWQFVVIALGQSRQLLVDAMAVEWRQHLAADGVDAALIAERHAASAARIVAAPALVMPCIDRSLLDVYPDAPRQHAEYTMAVQSIGCAIQNMLLTAVALGYDAGWMCAPLFCGDMVRRALMLPEVLDPQALIPIGRMAVAPKRRPKRPAVALRIDR